MKKKAVIVLLKVVPSIAILAYLVWDAVEHDTFANLQQQSKQWGRLAAACVVCASAVTLTIARWCYLVRALEIPFQLKDALRFGFLGYLVNLAPLGIVGGDVVKGLMLDHRHPGHRTEALATVFLDRLIGLYTLSIVASMAILMTGVWRLPDRTMHVVCQAALAVTAMVTAGIVLLLIPGVANNRLTRRLRSMPYAGPILRRLIGAARMYRRKPQVLLVAVVMSFGVHTCFSSGIYLVASGLYEEVVSLGKHFVVSPLSAVGGVIPLSMGPFEFLLDRLYPLIPLESGARMALGQGLVVALAYRVICVLVAAIGLCYYLGSRREVSEVLHEAELQAEEGAA